MVNAANPKQTQTIRHIEYLFMPAALRISDRKWLAKGQQRLVFGHPNDRRFVLKVQMTDRADATSGIEASRHVCREKAVYRMVEGRLAQHPNPPIARFHGMTVTDLGSADVYEAIYGIRKRKLAPTLGQLVRAGRFRQFHLRLLNAFVRLVDDWDIPVTDMNAGNLVFGARHGTPQCIMVDGFGDYRIVPFAQWSRRIRRARVSKGCARIAMLHGLHWDNGTRQFST